MLDKPYKSVGKLWVDFYEAEKRLYDFLQTQNMIHAYDGCEPKYQTKTVCLHGQLQMIEAPNTYVRATIALESPERIKTFHSLDSEVRERFIDAQENSAFKTTRPPARFPQYFEDVAQITLTMNDAVKSTCLDPNEEFIARKCPLSETSPFEVEADMLRKIGLDVRIKKGLSSYFLIISNKSLYQFAGAEKLQYRKRTGQRYIARVRRNAANPYEPKPKAVRKTYGLLILNRPCPVYDTAPRSDRDDRLDLTGQEVRLPIPIVGQLWKRD